MKKEMIRKRSAASTVMALFTVLMMTAVMTFAGAFAVFADDADPDQGQTSGKMRQVSKKEDVTFRGSGTPGEGAPPNFEMSMLSGHGQIGNQDADPDDESGEENMYQNDDNDINNYDIGTSSIDGNDPELSDNNLLSSQPLTEKDKTDYPEKEEPADIEKNQPEKDVRPDNESEKDHETNDNAVIRISDKNSDTSDNEIENSGKDITRGSGSTNSSDASAGSAGTGSPQTGDSNVLADAMTLLILSMACLASMMHSRKNMQADMQGH